MNKKKLIGVWLLLLLVFFIGLSVSYVNATVDEETPNNTSPTISPDGSQIAFVSSIHGTLDLWIINSDGTGLKKITSGFPVWNPKWSPNSSKIAFASNKEGSLDIWVINLSDSSLTQLTKDSGYEDGPAWSPDGTKIVYDNDAGDIIVINSDGTNPQKIVNGLGGSPAWSPDGSKIVFHRNYKDNFWNLWLINIDGTGLIQLTSEGYVDWNPAWSPDGFQIVFASNRADAYVGGFDIWTINPDGTNLQQVNFDQDAPSSEFDPTWAPDGTRIVYECMSENNSNIWIMDEWGDNQQQITFLNEFIPESIPATIEIQPDKWNIQWLKEEKEHKEDHPGEGKIKCYIGNIVARSINDILPETILLNDTIPISEHGKKEKLDAKVKKHRKELEGEVLEVKFNKFEAIKSLGEINPGDIVTVTVTGELSDGKTFKGEDIIQIIGKELKEKKEK